MDSARWTLGTLLLMAAILFSSCTFRYYNTYISYGSGDTIIQTFHNHGGPNNAGRKWNAECLDGQAMVGISDVADDFARVQQLWCKQTFANKPSSGGLYPYYPSCHVRNYTTDYHCFNPLNAERTINTFITGIWSNQFFWWVFQNPQQNQSLFKCCRPPTGYYVDYLSCYYMATHDQTFEYYDNTWFFITYCAQGFVMTGISKKVNPYTKEFHVDWIQCCRMGFGPHEALPPPVKYAPSGAASYYAPRADVLLAGEAGRGLYNEDKVRRKRPNDGQPAEEFYGGLAGNVSWSARSRQAESVYDVEAEGAQPCSRVLQNSLEQPGVVCTPRSHGHF